VQDALLDAAEAPGRRKKREKRDWGWSWRELSKLKHALLDLGATSEKKNSHFKISAQVLAELRLLSFSAL